MEANVEVQPEVVLAYPDKESALLEAVRAYDNVLQISTNDFKARRGKGVALSELGKHEEAIEEYNKAIQINSTYALGYFSKGNALFRLERYDEAIVQYNKVLQIDDKFVQLILKKETL